MKVFLCSAFSFNMVAPDDTHKVRAYDMCLEEMSQTLSLFREMGGVEVVDAVGHESTATLMTSLLKQPVKAARVDVCLSGADILLVAQYSGTRLPEGATELPEGATLRWLRVHLVKES